MSKAEQRVMLPGEHISAEHATDDVAKVRHVVYIRQCTGDQHITLAFYR